MAAGDVMTGAVALLAGDYITLRRGLGYRSRVSERYLRAFARYLDRAGHDGPISLEQSLDWAASTASADPCIPARPADGGAGLAASPVRPRRRH